MERAQVHICVPVAVDLSMRSFIVGRNNDSREPHIRATANGFKIFPHHPQVIINLVCNVFFTAWIRREPTIILDSNCLPFGLYHQDVVNRTESNMNEVIHLVAVVAG